MLASNAAVFPRVNQSDSSPTTPPEPVPQRPTRPVDRLRNMLMPHILESLQGWLHLCCRAPATRREERPCSTDTILDRTTEEIAVTPGTAASAAAAVRASAIADDAIHVTCSRRISTCLAGASASGPRARPRLRDQRRREPHAGDDRRVSGRRRERPARHPRRFPRARGEASSILRRKG